MLQLAESDGFAPPSSWVPRHGPFGRPCDTWIRPFARALFAGALRSLLSHDTQRSHPQGQIPHTASAQCLEQDRLQFVVLRPLLAQGLGVGDYAFPLFLAQAFTSRPGERSATGIRVRKLF